MAHLKCQISKALSWIEGSSPEQHYQACMLLRIAAERDSFDKEDDAVVPALANLVEQYDVEHSITLVALEAIALLIEGSNKQEWVSWAEHQARAWQLHHCKHSPSSIHNYYYIEVLRRTNGIPRMMKFLIQAPASDAAHCVLVIFQVLGDKEADRKTLLSCNFPDAAKQYLLEGPLRVEARELALSALCNVAAGSQLVKQQLCEAGVIELLLRLLSSGSDKMLAQLAALALRNLSRNAASREEIEKLQGVPMLLQFLGDGLEQLQYPLFCEAIFNAPADKGGQVRNRSGLMAIDINKGHLLLSLDSRGGFCCMGKTVPASRHVHTDPKSKRFSLLMKTLQFTMPYENCMELHFNVDGNGVEPVRNNANDIPCELLVRVLINDCDAQELSELMTKLLNKFYTMQDFNIPAPGPPSLASTMPGVLQLAS